MSFTILKILIYIYKFLKCWVEKLSTIPFISTCIIRLTSFFDPSFRVSSSPSCLTPHLSRKLTIMADTNPNPHSMAPVIDRKHMKQCFNFLVYCKYLSKSNTNVLTIFTCIRQGLHIYLYCECTHSNSSIQSKFRSITK